jgi:hypothetical protein
MFKACVKAIFFILFSGAIAFGGETVKKEELTGLPFVADFYHVDSSEKQPGVIVLGGSEGGKPDSHLPEMLAQNGYAVLSLAYFNAKGLPENLELIPLEYFDQPIQWLEKNPSVQPGGVILVGASVGAELALLVAAHHPEVRGVIATAPSAVVWQGLSKMSMPLQGSSWSLNGNALPFLPYDASHGFNPTDPLAIYKLYQDSLENKDAVERAVIPVEKINGPILLLSGQDDHLWPSAQMGDMIGDRLKAANFKYKFEHVKYESAGHTLSEFYMIGGTTEGNRKARLESTDKMLEFLSQFRVKPPVAS